MVKNQPNLLFSLINFFLPKFLLDVNLEITDGKGNAT